MKRATITRGPAPKRTARLTRKTRVATVNRRRRAKRNIEAFGPQAALCRSLPCCVCGKWATAKYPTIPHHEGHSRGAGGKDSECVPLCWVCHQLRHSEGKATFWSKRGWTATEVYALMRRLRERAGEAAA